VFVLVSVRWASPTALKLMGSYLVFAVVGFILVLFCLEAQPGSSNHSPSSTASTAAAAAASATDSNVQKRQLKVLNEPSLRVDTGVSVYSEEGTAFGGGRKPLPHPPKTVWPLSVPCC